LEHLLRYTAVAIRERFGQVGILFENERNLPLSAPKSARTGLSSPAEPAQTLVQGLEPSSKPGDRPLLSVLPGSCVQLLIERRPGIGSDLLNCHR
jgi:hypothetical protein